MAEVKRYYCAEGDEMMFPTMFPEGENANWVRYSDYAALEAQLKEAEAEALRRGRLEGAEATIKAGSTVSAVSIGGQLMSGVAASNL